MKSICLLLGSSVAMFAQVAGDMAWKELADGNGRCMMGKARHPHQDEARRKEIAQGQHPIAAVLSCSDSRVAPEVVFDQGLGDLFTIRVAGNVPTDDVIASMEYAVEHLGTRLIVVMGHQRCGAVDAALKGGEAEGHLPVLLDWIRPAVEMARGTKGDPLDFAVRANVRNVVEKLTKCQPILAEKIERDEVKIVGVRYELDSGKVELVK
ncbi:MAG TPA: carbonic anhydrase [Bryobacteraceae bacterium]|nr:carbonic anhydrase [Bryobacteraceae bacterium]